jgi:hypothetical protein
MLPKVELVQVSGRAIE